MWALGTATALALALALAAILALAGAASAAEVTGAADDLRTGWYPDEPALTPALLAGGSFQQVFKASLQGQIYAQPLTADGTLLVVTEDDRAYGLDPNSGAVRWEDQLGTPVNSSEAPIECTGLSPRIGVTGTPVIDASAGIAYFVSNSYVHASSGPIAWYMHAVALADGREVPGFPVQISGEAQNLGGVPFEATQELQRPALLLTEGVVYAAFGSHCDKAPYEGWIAGVKTSGQLVTLWASAHSGASIWQSGGGLVSDAPGQILLATGNDSGAPGEGDPPKGAGSAPPEGRLGESVVRVQAKPGGGLAATDFFSPFNSAQLDEGDVDLGSGAPIALPSPYFGTASVPHLLVQVGKQGYVYVLNRDHLGGMGQGPAGSDQVVQRLGPYGGVWDGSAVWPGEGGYLYIPGVNGGSDHLRFFKNGVNEGTGEPALSLAATSPEEFAFGSGAPIVTSNATKSGSAIVWINRCTVYACGEGELVAYAPVPLGMESLRVLWHARLGAATKFSRPDAAGGHIYVGNHEGALLAFSGPSLTPSPSALDLGSGTVGEPLDGTVTLTNTGTKLKVSAVRAPSAPFQANGLPAPGSELAPGQQITVSVSLQASSAGSFGGSLGLTTEAGETRVALSGSLAPPVPSEPAAAPQGGSGASVLQGPAPLTAPIVSIEAPASLTRLRVLPATSARARRRHRREVAYALSAVSSVSLVVERPVIGRRCLHGAPICLHYVPTHVALMIRGHAQANLDDLDLARLPAGEYRLRAVAIDSAGGRGAARYVAFSLA
jgi:hypothetical protein